MHGRQLNGFEQKVIPFIPRFKLRNRFPGEWESVWRGESGIEFAESKPFEPGDDPRDIDIRYLAQTGEEYIVRRAETRQMKVYAWADFSASMQRFDQMLFAKKPDVRDIAIGLILYSAAKLYAPVGFYPFGLANGKFFPPRTGESYCEAIMDGVAATEKPHPFVSSGAEKTFSDLTRLAYPRNMVFMISDFQQRLFDKDFAGILRPVAARFDLIPVVIIDPLQVGSQPLRSFRIRVQSAGVQTKEMYVTPRLLQEVRTATIRHRSHLEENFRRVGLDYIVLDSSSAEECQRRFLRFFEIRRRRRV